MPDNELKLIADENDIRLDLWLSKQLDGKSRTYIQKLIEDKMVQINDKFAKVNYKLKKEDIISVKIPEPEKLDLKPENIELDIVYEDNDIIVINKPKGMVVHPAVGNYSGTLVNALLAHCDDDLSDINGVIRPGIVHRIDKDTTGLLVVAKNNKAHEVLSEGLKEHSIKRVYVALVDGIIREECGKIDAPIGRHPVDRKKMAVNIKNGRNAVTRFKVLERFNDATLVELSLETGRTHQIRVHMSYIGFPVMGDVVYGRKNKRFELQGQVLHAKKLGLVHPVKNEYMEFETDFPQYFKDVLDEYRNNL